MATKKTKELIIQQGTDVVELRSYYLIVGKTKYTLDMDQLNAGGRNWIFDGGCESLLTILEGVESNECPQILRAVADLIELALKETK